MGAPLHVHENAPEGRRPRVLLTLLDRPGGTGSGKHLRMAATLDALNLVAEVDIVVLIDAERASAQSAESAASPSPLALVKVETQRRPAPLLSAVGGVLPWRIAA